MQMRPMIGIMLFLCAAGSMRSQDASPPASPAQPQTIIRAEKKLVLVDTVVTDKKGNYIHDLTQKDFRVWEDNKEQDIETFSFEAGPSVPANLQKHYLVLFFDNSSLQFTDQMQARSAALKFLDANTGPNKLIAVVNFGGSLQIAQNFTSDADRLKQVVSGVKFSATSTNPEIASLGAPSLGRAAADFGARDVLLALRTLSKSLGTVPGRKTLVFLSAGFNLDSELRSELTAVIDVCNKANVAVYPIDVRGLVAVAPGGSASNGAFLLNASYMQHGGTGTGSSSGGGGHTGGGSSGGGKSSVGGTGGRAGGGSTGTRAGGLNNPLGQTNNPFSQSRVLVPHIPDVTSQQAVLYELASGTGGFVIVNTNDLLGGLNRIANEQDQYYVLGYSPSKESEEGACHELKVKVNQSGATVRARSGYCTAKPLDLLAGTPAEKNLENRAAAAAAGNVTASMQTPYFYTSANTARVNVAMEIPSASITFKKEKGKLRSEMNVMGIASQPDGSVAAKFSDVVKLEFDNKKELEQFQEQLMHYETQFDIASGKYDLKVVFSAGGESFGKLQVPLVVDPYDNKKFDLSAVALSRDIRNVSQLDVGLDSVLLEDKTPLVAQGYRMTPSGSSVLKKTEPAAIYIEVYEPLLAESKEAKVGLQMRLVDRKSGEQKLDTGFLNMANYIRAGNPVIPVGLKVPLETLAAGQYRAELRAIDSAGNKSVIRAADFEVQ